MNDAYLFVHFDGLGQWPGIVEVDQHGGAAIAEAGLADLAIGMGFVVGISATIDLRILGFAPALRLAAMEKFLPVLWLGFWVNAITGTILLAIDVVNKLANVDFYIKMAFIA